MRAARLAFADGFYSVVLGDEDPIDSEDLEGAALSYAEALVAEVEDVAVGVEVGGGAVAEAQRPGDEGAPHAGELAGLGLLIVGHVAALGAHPGLGGRRRRSWRGGLRLRLGLFDLLLRRCTNVRFAIDDPRDGLDRDAGKRRNILDRGSAPAHVYLGFPSLSHSPQ